MQPALPRAIVKDMTNATHSSGPARDNGPPRAVAGGEPRRCDAWSVFVVDNGRASLRSITIGARNSTVAEVRGGLEAGDVVVNHPGDTVSDGAAVTVDN